MQEYKGKRKSHLMKAVVQRVSWAKVSVGGEEIARIDQGFMILLGVGVEDEEQEAKKLAEKIIKLRLFNDEQGKMNRSIKEVEGEILCISQFTLFADTRKGNRPSFTGAAPGEKASELYRSFCKFLEEFLGKSIQTGRFGADMNVELLNQGPVTILINTQES